MRSKTLLGCIAIMLAVASVRAPAQETYPARPVRIIVGFGPGSTADVLARILGQRMGSTLGQQIVVENRPGAASMIAAEMVTRAPGDGYTLFMATVANTINPTLSATSTFNLGRDLAPVALVGAIPNVLVAHPSIKVNNVQELTALALSNGDSLIFASSGSGTAGHLAAELFNEKTGAKIRHVFYSGGSAQAVSDLLTGRVNLMFAVASTMLPQVRAGKLKALAVAQSRRAYAMPDVPTMAEAGMPGFEASIWIGLLAPPGTKREIVDALGRSVNEALQTEDVLKSMRLQGFDAIGGSPQEFASFIAADIRKWDEVARSSGLKK